MSLFAELKRRHVFRVAVAYLALAWLLTEVAGTLFPGFGIPDWAFRFVVIVLALGFVPVMIFTWAYEITPEGLKREKDVVRDEAADTLTAKRLDKLTIGLVLVALAFVMVDRLWLAPRQSGQAPIAMEAPAEAARTVASERELPANSIAVLPFANRSARPEDVFFVDGIHDDLLTFISQIGSIKTISRTSVMKYRDSTLSIPDIARELAVTTVLEGGVQRAGEQVRINVQLIDARTDDHLWSQIYDRQLTASNIFAIQSEIAGSIAEALRAELTPETSERIESVPTENLKALEAYFLGRQSMATRRIADLAMAVEHFEEAVALDPEFALAWAGLSQVSLLYPVYAGLLLEKWFEKSRAAAGLALQLDPGLAEAYTADGKRKDFERDYEGAEASFKRAIQLNPNHAPAYQWYGQMLGCRMNRPEDALDFSRRAVELDPRSAIIRSDYSDVLTCGGRFDEAMEQLRQSVEIEPRFAKGHRLMGLFFRLEFGLLDKALASYHRAFSIDSESMSGAQVIGLIYLELGDLEHAGYWSDKTVELTEDNFVPDLVVALHLYRGEYDTALEYARKDLDFSPDSIHSLRLIRDNGIREGNLGKIRERFEQAHPELFDEKDPNIASNNWEAAVELAYLLMQTGEQGLADLLLDQSLAHAASQQAWSANERNLLEARVHAVRGEWPLALAALGRAVDAGWRWHTWYYFEHDSVFEPLHDEPEFQALKSRVEADLAEQLARVREMEASGELPAVP